VFRKILIANRGEIACRIIATARRLGMATVAVYSDADRNALHVRLADEAHRIGPAPARESYLNGEAILAAAKVARAEAIHPGYGFLSENEAFTAACARAALVFVGPSPQAIAAMGDKAAAKRLMEKAGVPLVPGYHGEGQEPALLAREAARLGFPVLIKPSAGGGGKGMRVVADAARFSEALEAAQREAKAAFGDPRVLLERYLERPRHIEVQVFGDSRGNVLHLFERDCSVQRRHQKVLEEAPAPRFSRRDEIGATAVSAARAIRYTGAGTVEFIAEPDGRFYFMEMNTRLQVEHPVTELITGLDLVELQLRVAAGEPLPFRQDELKIDGHAIEARVYAEDPARDFLPSTGRLAHLAFPEGVRVDTGVEAGSEISSWYDPMLAKVIAHGRDRTEALHRLRAALAATEVAGVATNVEFLRRICESRAFREADLDTHLIERHRDELLAPRRPLPAEVLQAAAEAELRHEESGARAHARRSGDPRSPWHAVDGWRLNGESRHEFVFVHEGAEHRVRVDPSANIHARCVRVGRNWHVFHEGEHWTLALRDPLAGLDLDAASGSLAAPMPGRVVKLLVEPGAKVAKGQALLILEAMKMEHTIVAPAEGTVAEVHCAEGEQVLEGIELIRLEQ
jgi:3-methylcrotonyl-CoA carboxylase alpha subunit